MTDYREGMDILKMVGTDASKWAEAFQQLIVDPGKEIDEGLMIGWFANAIEAGRTAGAEAVKQ